MMSSSRLMELFLWLLLAAPLLVAADWQVTVDGVYGQSIDFSTGNAPGGSMKVELYDLCRVDAAERTFYGELYPANGVYGFDMDDGGIVNNPGSGNKISYAFIMEDLNTTSMWTDNGDDTGTVEFCAQVGLYDGSTLSNLAEVKVEYRVTMPNNDVSLETYTITDAAGYTDADDTNLAFDGSLETYFCDPNSHNELGNYGPTAQGSVISVCFRVPDGQFEIKDVMDLTIKNAEASDPNQLIVQSSAVVEESIALKTCYDNDDSDTNICIVQFILRENLGFFDTSTITLTGTGTVLLEFGDAPGSRRRRQVVASTTTTASSSTAVADHDIAAFSDAAMNDEARRLQEEGIQQGHYITTPFNIRWRKFLIATDQSLTPSLTSETGSASAGVLITVVISTCALAAFVFICMVLRKSSSSNHAATLQDEVCFNDKYKHDQGAGAGSRRRAPVASTEFIMDASGATLPAVFDHSTSLDRSKVDPLQASAKGVIMVSDPSEQPIYDLHESATVDLEQASVSISSNPPCHGNENNRSRSIENSHGNDEEPSQGDEHHTSEKQQQQEEMESEVEV